MKTKTTMSNLETAGNEFHLANPENYTLVEVTAYEGKASVTMSFPWHNSIPFKDATVQNTIKKYQEDTKKILVAHLEKNEKNNPLAEKCLAFLRREISYALSMTRIGGGRE